MSLDHRPRLIIDVVRIQLHRLFRYPPSGFRVLDDALQRMLHQYGNRKNVKVMSQLPRRDEESESQFFHPLIAGLGSGQRHTEVVPWFLNAFILANQSPAHNRLRHGEVEE